MFECYTLCNGEENCVGFNYRTTQNIENCQLTNVTNNRGNSKKGDWILMRLDIAVGEKNNPGKSCLDILLRKKTASLGNGEYWIKLDNKTLKVYCDMKSDGGGWTLVTNLVVNQSKGMDVFLTDDYKQISEYKNQKLAISTYALHDLASNMSFNQLRFFCRKKTVGRVFDIATNKTNNLGQEVIKYFTAQTNTLPKSCGSYYRLPDDNSTMASQCAQWGYESGNFHVGKWHYEGLPVKYRLFDIPVFIGFKVHCLIQQPHSRWECDDYSWDNNDTLSRNDFWKIFVR
ncbi:uncharacterized protein LOC114528938 [Dendronephthya gigantea]|uniref:uncharacterized protein LOC114528938 n=1 Tax=Dendronephthya gigantea TaxID=151771 RepID=UPI00106AF721|nr:uncharacterized protein LOC114528938 [Dendronephthya gigantea]